VSGGVERSAGEAGGRGFRGGSRSCVHRVGFRSDGGAHDRWRGCNAGVAGGIRTDGSGSRDSGAHQSGGRAERGRKKKLIVAFHFFRTEAGRANAGWDCEQCRRQKLEARRRCGFLGEAERGAPRVVWARDRAVAEECPKSLITAVSMELLERFWVWKAS